MMDWPIHVRQTRVWNPHHGQGSKADRTLDHIEVSIPPMIGHLDYVPPSMVMQAMESAVISVARLEAGFGDHLAPLAGFLLRSESVASSRIESVDAGWRSFGRAVAGGKATDDAKSQLATVRALAAMTDATRTGAIELDTLLDAHRMLMAPDFYTARDSGRIREVQNWIGGSDYSPINALYVPPPPELVPGLLDDLLVFANRSDLPIVAQAAIAHAQFESIHPFTDGNGRIGRALISAILRIRGLTRRVTVPLASAMLADTRRYFSQLTAYRAGDVDTFVEYLASATRHASLASEQSALTLSELPERWRQAATPRANSSDETLIAHLLDSPILNADMAQKITGTSDASTYRSLQRLVGAGVLELISTSKRNQVWAATDVLAELDALSDSIGRRTTDHV